MPAVRIVTGLFSALVIAALVAGAPAAGIGGQAGAAQLQAGAAQLTASTISQPAPDPAGTVWLCRPGQANDPCTQSLETSVVPAKGPTTVEHPTPASSSHFDCFYVYPTVSSQKTTNANLTVQETEVATAEAQVSQFSPYCEVWAPMYRQVTTQALVAPNGSIIDNPAANAVAYASVLSAWKDFLANYDDRRPIIFIGHSQGAAMLIRLLRAQIDPNSSLRSRLVSAIILGGNVTVPQGKTVGATFRHIPTCRSTRQTGCVIAYSSFPSEPPSNSTMGRPGQGVSLQSDQTAKKGLQVACTNPASLSGGTGDLLPYFPVPASDQSTVGTPWVAFPDLYTATCKSKGGATWLQVTTIKTKGDKRPTVTENAGPKWGYHGYDVNLGLGNLTQDVHQEEMAYGR
jgi:hypothetical protein